ncbi:TetR/AcrR family transcriptional regulator [Tenggerimyces flavus]|uniref:TetR/AcrR family transcriptional regulator n=1 Tax=Tenggerimyces flavus TaxID=1708749 RepID=A0ABV7YHX1_9ACTN|nr:TetR/AcrR family transcriptional regulator [Tenggerimyces flavus]MBM7789872.1 TetR/AcrR family fatty acid metabolism transcriptional regulator [Tenggerimyces flavus]
MAPRRVDAEARRTEILAAAVRTFARKGYAATRIEDVAAEAGIGKGSVYLYFDSRESLLHSAFQAMTTASQGVLDAAREGAGTPLERLAGLIRDVLGMIASDPDLSVVLLDFWAAGRLGDAPQPIDMAQLYVDYRAVIVALLREAATEGTVREDVGEQEAMVLVGAIEGCMLQWVMDPRISLPGLAEPIVAVCIDGLRKEK